MADDVRFLGSIYVSGRIHGTLVTPPGAADYGEWFPSDDYVPGHGRAARLAAFDARHARIRARAS